MLQYLWLSVMVVLREENCLLHACLQVTPFLLVLRFWAIVWVANLRTRCVAFGVDLDVLSSGCLIFCVKCEFGRTYLFFQPSFIGQIMHVPFRCWCQGKTGRCAG